VDSGQLGLAGLDGGGGFVDLVDGVDKGERQMEVPEDLEEKKRALAAQLDQDAAALRAKLDREEASLLREQKAAELESRRLAARRAEQQARLSRIVARSTKPRFRAPAYSRRRR
jgi:hypothetical protein